MADMPPEDVKLASYLARPGYDSLLAFLLANGEGEAAQKLRKLVEQARREVWKDLS